MTTVDLGSADEGFQKFTINGQEFEVDIYEILKYVYNIQRARTDFSVEDPSIPLNLIEDIAKYLNSKGIQRVSLLTASKFLRYVFKLADELKKNIDLTVP